MLPDCGSDSSECDELVRRCQAGDRTAFDRLYQRYHRSTYRLVYSMLLDRELAEDMTQEVFVKAWRQIRRFQGRSRFSTWLHAVAVRHCIDALRRSRGRFIPGSADPFDETTAPPDLLRRLLADEATRERYRAVREAVHALPKNEEAVVVLHFFAGYSVPEVAAALGWPERTTRSRLRGAIDRLHRHLEGLFE